MIESAKQTGRDARDRRHGSGGRACDARAMREAGHQIEQGYHDTVDYMSGGLKQVESRTATAPRSALSPARWVLGW